MAQLNIQCPSGASLVVQWLRLLTSIAGSVGSTPVQRCQFRSLGGKDPLGEGMATRSRLLAWRIPWTEEPGGSFLASSLPSPRFAWFGLGR